MSIEKIKLHTAIRRFLTEDPQMINGAASTVKSYRRTLEILRKVTSSQLGAYELRNEHIDLCILDLRRGASPEENATRVRAGQSPRKGRGVVALNQDISALKALVGFLHRREYLSAARNPTMHLKRQSGHTKKPIEEMVVQPNQAVIDKLLETAGNRHPRDRVVVALGIYGGLRESELLRLLVGGIDFGKGELRVWREKVQSWHRVPLHHQLATELRMWLAWMERNHGPLNPEWFVVAARQNNLTKLDSHGNFNPSAGQLTVDTPVDPTKPAWSVAKDVKKAFGEAGHPGLYRLGGHTLRRMAAIHVTNTTGNRRFAKTLLGHKDERTTEGYLQWSDDTEQLRQALAGLAPAPEPEPTAAPTNVVRLDSRRRVA